MFPHIFIRHHASWLPALTAPKLSVKVSCAFSGRKRLYVPPFISLSSLLSTLTAVYSERRTHVQRTSYTRTANVVHTYSERRTHVHRTSYTRTPNDVRRRFHLMAEAKQCSGGVVKVPSCIRETFRAILIDAR